MKKTLVSVTFCFVILAAALVAAAQTFEIQGQPDKPSSTSPANPAANKKKGTASEDSGGDIGWGSSIEVGRMAKSQQRPEEAIREYNVALSPLPSAEASFSYSRGMSFHDYDNVQSGFFISYVKPWRRMLNDATGAVPVEYPLRFSFGIQNQEFASFAGRGVAQFAPVVRLTLF